MIEKKDFFFLKAIKFTELAPVLSGRLGYRKQ